MDPHSHKYRETDSRVICSCGWTAARSQDNFQVWLAHFMSPEFVRSMVSRAAVRDIVRQFQNLEHFHWDLESSGVLQVACGWWAHVNRCAYAIENLYGAGAVPEATILLRSCLEYALALRALGDEREEAILAAQARHAKHSRDLRRDVSGGPMEKMFELATKGVELEIGPSGAGWTQKVDGICRKYGATATVYMLYRVLCSITHPTLTSADAYFATDEQTGHGTFRRNPTWTFDDDLAFWTCICLVWSWREMGKLVKSIDGIELVDRAARELGIFDLADTSKVGFGTVQLTEARLNEVLFGHDRMPI